MITVFGSTNLDQIGTVPRLPQPGETIAGGTFRMTPGGKGADQALAARRAGASVRHVSAVGKDVFAAQALAHLDADGVDLTGIRKSGEATGIAMILVEAGGENVIAVLPGANASLTAADARAELSILAPGDTLLLQQEIPQEATSAAIDVAGERGATVIFNTAPFLDDTPALARRATIVVANETEFALLTACNPDGMESAMEQWITETGATIVVTLGAKGVRVAGPDGSFAVPALKITPVDTVGAGDTFCGYLGAGLEAGLPLEPAVRRAAVAASIACLREGAQTAIPHATEVDVSQAG